MVFQIKTHEDILADVLSDPFRWDWIASGLGMVRCYLSPDRSVRLHIWTRALRAPGVSMIHTHPWWLTSHIVRGRLYNHTYDEAEKYAPGTAAHHRRKMRCGDNFGQVGEDTTVPLIRRGVSFYYPGDNYCHRPADIHETVAADGTVTVMRRDQAGRDFAYIYWPHGEEFGDSYQRPATRSEIVAALDTITPAKD